MISQSELETAVHKAISLYNRLRSPEVVAKIIRVSPETVTIGFSGSFCYNCAVPLNYIKDFESNLKVFTDKVELIIGATRQTGTNSFETDYTVKAQ